MAIHEWIIRPNERKQIKLLKIPRAIEKKYNIKDGRTISVEIRDMTDNLHFIGPLTVTSGGELYLPNNVRRQLEKIDKFIISIREGLRS